MLESFSKVARKIDRNDSRASRNVSRDIFYFIPFYSRLYRDFKRNNNNGRTRRERNKRNKKISRKKLVRKVEVGKGEIGREGREVGQVKKKKGNIGRCTNINKLYVLEFHSLTNAISRIHRRSFIHLSNVTLVAL